MFPVVEVEQVCDPEFDAWKVRSEVVLVGLGMMVKTQFPAVIPGLSDALRTEANIDVEARMTSLSFATMGAPVVNLKTMLVSCAPAAYGVGVTLTEVMSPSGGCEVTYCTRCAAGAFVVAPFVTPPTIDWTLKVTGVPAAPGLLAR